MRLPRFIRQIRSRRLRTRPLRQRLLTMLLLVICVCTVIFMPLYVIYKPPSSLIRHFQRRWPDVLWHVSTKSRIIALTIDDGPSQYTREILSVLRENEATATFFIIGSQARESDQKEALKEIVRSGNELGNHAMYDEPSRTLDDGVLSDQIQSVEQLIAESYSAAGIENPPKYFRPGSGIFNKRMRDMVKMLGYRMVLGSIYPHDPQVPYWKLNANHILSMLKPGSIIVCHDRRSWTVPMLQKVLPEARRRGYRIVTVTELLRAAES